MSGGTERAHVLFFTSELGGGGAEKHLVRVASHLDRSRFRVSVAVARGGGSYEAELPADVRLHALGTRRVTAAAFPFRALVEREAPDLVCSVMDHANCVALAAGIGRAGPPVVACVQIPPGIELRRGVRGRAILAVLPSLYRRAARVVALSRGVEGDLRSLVPGIGPKLELVYNAGYDEAVLRLSREAPEEAPPPGEGPVLVACGRLAPQKAFDVLLRAFRRVRDRGPARLWIVGEGPLRGALEEEARGLGLSADVWFAGFRANPYAYMRAADVFVLSSAYEGFGNVIVEAMAVGTPVVSTDCPHGPSEIIRDGQSGLLAAVGDADALGDAVLRVLGDAHLRARLAAEGEARARDFSAARIAGEYGEVFDRVLGRGAARPALAGD